MTCLVPDNVLIDGKRIAHGVHGNGTPVVLVHGTPFFSYIWRNVLPQLVDAGYRVYLYDLLGFGHSERPVDLSVDTSVSAQLPLLLGLLDHWGLESSHVVAHDIGGAVAQQLAVYHPGRIRTLTLIDPVSFDSWPSQRTREQMAAGLETLIAADADTHRAHFREWLLSASARPEQLEAGPLDVYLDRICGPVGQASLFQHQIRHYDPQHTMKIAERLPELAGMPVQLLWGEADNWQVTDWAYRLHDAIPGSRLHLIPQCGHLAPEDQPTLVAERVVEHLRRPSAN